LNVSSEYFYATSVNNRTVEIGNNPTNLTIWDQTDNITGYNISYLGDGITYYANYTKYVDQLPLTLALCNISFHDGSYANMTYNSSSGLYVYTHTFYQLTDLDLQVWHVNCSQVTYEPQYRNDTIVVRPKTNYSVLVNITSIGDAQYNVTYRITNLAKYNDSVTIHDILSDDFVGYSYSHLPSTTTVSAGLFRGTTQNMTRMVANGSSSDITYLVNGSGLFESDGLYFAGG